MSTETNVPEPPSPTPSTEFEKIIKDFVNDIQNTFPEYNGFINKWWKDISHFQDIDNVEEREKAFKLSREKSILFIFNYCSKKFPPRFFDILNKNTEIFDEDSDVNTEFLPQIHFKNLWQCDISDDTRETIWKYLQIILFSIIGSLNSKDAFGDTAKLFETMDQELFKKKLEETVQKMQDMFDFGGGVGVDGEKGNGNEGAEETNANTEKGEKMYQHILGMMDGKLGKFAKELAEETAADLNMDMDNIGSVQDVFKNLFQNPSKMMDIVKNVGEKLDTKLKSGEIKENELLSEATEMIQKMKQIPGMENIQEMMAKMGMGLGKGQKLNYGAMEAQFNRNLKQSQMKERMRKNLDIKKSENAAKEAVEKLQQSKLQSSGPPLSDEELISMMNMTSVQEKEDKNKKEKKDKKNKKK